MWGSVGGTSQCTKQQYPNQGVVVELVQLSTRYVVDYETAVSLVQYLEVVDGHRPIPVTLNLVWRREFRACMTVRNGDKKLPLRWVYEGDVMPAQPARTGVHTDAFRLPAALLNLKYYAREWGVTTEGDLALDLSLDVTDCPYIVPTGAGRTAWPFAEPGHYYQVPSSVYPPENTDRTRLHPRHRLRDHLLWSTSQGLPEGSTWEDMEAVADRLMAPYRQEAQDLATAATKRARDDDTVRGW